MVNLPCVFEIREIEKVENREWLDLMGRGFSAKTRVWFGTLKSMETKYL